MKIKMLRSLGRTKENLDKEPRLEGETYEVSQEEGEALLKQGLAEHHDEKKAAPGRPGPHSGLHPQEAPKK